MHPLLALLATRPQLLVEHTQAYAMLFNEELGLACAAWRYQALLQAMALCFLGVTVVLGGGALMLWAATPEPQIHAPWLLVATPLLALLVSLTCLVMARRQAPAATFVNLSRQISADMDMLRMVSAP